MDNSQLATDPSPLATHVLCGFGFGPIQSGLFACEAFRSGRFRRIVIAEVDQALVDAVAAAGGVCAVNIAGADGITVQRIEGVELYNPQIERDRAALVAALREATEIVTALPSVDFYDRGASSPAALIAEAVRSASFSSYMNATLVYAAENNNHAAEILEEKVGNVLRGAGTEVTFMPHAPCPMPLAHPAQFLNTVIGKMSRVVTDPAEIAAKGLAELAPGCGRAHLVESFNRILVTRCAIPGFRPGIESFIEKDDLLPFEEAKLYGHNAVHALLGFLGALKGYTRMAELAGDAEIMRLAREAFINECGAALIKKYAALGDELFTPAGFTAYAEDLLTRIVNPHLDDSVARAARDPLRKLAPTDRIFGTMTLCLDQGLEPRNMALAAAAGITLLLRQVAPCQPLNFENSEWIDDMLVETWKGGNSSYRIKIIQHIKARASQLEHWEKK